MLFSAQMCPVLADGAMATNLFDRGLRPGDPPESWNTTYPARIETLHRDFLDAGAAIILTNSFGGHPHRLGSFGLADRTVELNRAAAQLARAAVFRAGRHALVAGAMGSTGAPGLAGAAGAGFAEQAAALVAGGADLLWIETMSDPEEMIVAATAAAATSRPYVLTASFDLLGRIAGGLDAAGFARHAASLRVPPAAIGANCGSGLAPMLRDLAAMRAAVPELPLVAKASAGLPDFRDGRFVHPRSCADMARYATAARDLGVAVIGGCCGTTPAHVGAMASVLAVSVPRSFPAPNTAPSSSVTPARDRCS